MNDGSRTVKPDLRPMLADFLREVDFEGMVQEGIAKAMHTAHLKAW